MAAALQRLLRIRLNVCKLNEENVVSPPQMPTAKNSLTHWPQANPPNRTTYPATSPVTNEPARFTTSVPYGKVSPTRLATQPDHQYRRILPITPPTKTKIISSTHPPSRARFKSFPRWLSQEVFEWRCCIPTSSAHIEIYRRKPRPRWRQA
jgi:hypothetical protein